jgi:hypothetical protein
VKTREERWEPGREAVRTARVRVANYLQHLGGDERLLKSLVGSEPRWGADMRRAVEALQDEEWR